MAEDEKRHLKIFKRGITVDLGLPKYEESANHQRIEEREAEKKRISELVLTDDIRDLNIALSKSDMKDMNMDLNTYNRDFSQPMDPMGRFAVEQRIIPIENKLNASSNPDFKEKKSWLKKLAEKFRSRGVDVDVPGYIDEALPDDEEAEDESSFKLDIAEMFMGIKDLAKNRQEEYKDRIKGYIALIRNAEASGQKALREKLVKGLIVAKYESILYASGYYKAISESKVAEFISQTHDGKNVGVSYIKNYTRIIPDEVIALKKQMDDLLIFDNYVVMAYDPDDTSSEMTDEEKKEKKRREEAAKRDPILFGVIANSDKLYYIADWEDEYCNLKFDDLVSAFNKGEVEKDFISKDVKQYAK